MQRALLHLARPTAKFARGPLPVNRPILEFQRALRQFRDSPTAPEGGLALLDELVSKGIQPDAFFSTSFILLCLRCNQPALACRTLTSLPLAERDRGVYLAMAKAISEGGWPWDVAKLMLDEAQASSHILDETITGMLAHGFYRRGDCEAALALFRRAGPTVRLSVQACNMLIEALRRQGRVREAFELFGALPKLGISPTAVTYRTLLSACAERQLYHLGSSLVDQITKKNLHLTESSVMALTLRFLGKAGRIDEMLSLWRPNQSTAGDVQSWTAVIDGLGEHGRGREALRVFEAMLVAGVPPDAKSLTAVLSACSHAGLVTEAKQFYAEMDCRFDVKPNNFHRAAMVDCIARTGDLAAAMELAESACPPSAVDFTAVLGACRNQLSTPGCLEIAKRAVSALERIGDENSITSAHVILEQIYGAAGLTAERMALRANRPRTAIPGLTQVEVNGELRGYKAHDAVLERQPRVMARLLELHTELERLGYRPDLALTDPIVGDKGRILSETERVDRLYTHSERVAIAVADLELAPKATIYMFKNLRVCTDCHAFSKAITKVLARDIIVRDANRFHHFSNGSCTCNDYW
eukprot:TRINITY_DN15899_c0_g1_i1.p1 TRINITY_DN15899_c0_g1~~TRINITY_DN15899_c0_g1_i1.p1  ORF type:complete len:595 (-),score=70.47 TRINITY_DN15899_c0_g1_i1:354-2108(-)